MTPVRTFCPLEPIVIRWCRHNRRIPGREGESTTPADQKLVERSKISTFRILEFTIDVVVKSLAKVSSRSAS